MTAISAVVLTKNEEKNIAGCLATLNFCDEIIVIDDHSSDETAKVAGRLGAKVFKRSLKDNFAQQRNFALDKAKNQWVFFVDADERVSFRLAEEIVKNVRQAKNEAFLFKRQDRILGRALKYGETASVRLLRLAKKGAGQWTCRVHEVWTIEGQKKTLNQPLLHDREISIEEFIKKINFYSTLRAKELVEQKTGASIFKIIVFPTGKFLQNYFLRLGFLDGAAGLAMALLMSIHSLTVRIKLWQECRLLSCHCEEEFN